MGLKKYTQEYIDNIRNDYLSGLSSVKIAIKYNISVSKVTYLLRKYCKEIIRSNKINSRKYIVNENYFDKIDDEHKAYWLGFIYADGYITNHDNQKQFGISLAEKDIDHIEKLRHDFNTDYPIRLYNETGYGHNKYARLLITSDHLFDQLANLGVIQHKTLVLQPPSNEIVDPKLIRHFVRGYFDGDGCITYANKKHTEFKINIVGTVPMLDYFKFIIQDNCDIVIHKYYKRNPDDVVCSIDFSGNFQVEKFLNYLYKDSTIYLNRKFFRYNELLNIIHSRI